MLSTLPKLVDKAFVLGFFLPVLSFVLASLALFSDLPEVKSLLATTETYSLEKFFYFVLIVWALAISMLLVNNLQYQILEGYRWPMSRLARLKDAERLRFKNMQGRIDALRGERRASKQELPADKLRELQDLWIEMRENFPADESLLLPTRFGNAILAFEEYPKDVYGADSVTIWFHLTAVITKPFQAALDEARAQVNCLVNLCFFSALISLAAIIRLTWNLIMTAKVQASGFDIGSFAAANLYIMGAVVVAAVLARMAYNLSIERVHTWGNLVRAAFDCFLPALATRLGYKLPMSGEEQRRFWIAVSQRVGFHYPLKPEDWIQVTPSNGEHNNKEGGDGAGNEEKDGSKGDVDEDEDKHAD
jgi:hypothetical protein